MTELWTSGAMSAKTWSRAGVMEVRFGGVVTPAGIAAYCRELSMRPAAAHAVCARFDGAQVAVYADKFTELFTGHLRRFSRPGAVVCKAGDVAMFDEHARQVIQLGVCRRTFTDAAEAFAWSQEKAAAARLATLSAMVRLQHAPTG